jgi:hypothetical protein
VTRCSSLARRAPERGAAVFVVVMAITLLTAVGLFAAHSATLVDQAAGYARMARQTQYLGEYGVLAAGAELAAGGADRYVRELEASAGSATVVCPANGGLTGVPCFKWFTSTLEARTLADTGSKLLEPVAGDGTPGSFGKGSAVGEFMVQITELGPVSRPIAGTDIGGQDGYGYRKVTATTTAQIRSSAAACAGDVATTIGQQTMRAQLLIGPQKN